MIDKKIIDHQFAAIGLKVATKRVNRTEEFVLIDPVDSPLPKAYISTGHFGDMRLSFEVDFSYTQFAVIYLAVCHALVGATLPAGMKLEPVKPRKSAKKKPTGVKK